MENLHDIFTDQIDLPPNNMREYIDRDELFELAADIKKNGLISPITIRPKNNRYELVAGQRRYLAHQIAGILKIKCFVKELDDEQAFAIMTSENLARVDVNPVDEAKHVARLVELNEGDLKKVSKIVGRGEQWVSDRLAIGEMPDYMQELLARKELKIGVALVLSQIKHDDMRRIWTLQAASEGVSVETAKYWFSDYKRRILPGGDLSGDVEGEVSFAPPEAVMFTCAIDGQRYDTRTLRSVSVYEGNLQYFHAFVSGFRESPAESES